MAPKHTPSSRHEDRQQPAEQATDYRLGLTSLNEDYRRDPWGRLAEARESNGGAHYDREMKTLLLLRAEQVDAVLKDRSLWMDPRKADERLPLRALLVREEERQPSMLFLDDPDHKRLRSLVAPEFTPRALEKWRVKTRTIAEALLDQVQGKQQWDLIGDYAGPLPTTVIATMLGLDEADLDWFKTASDAIAMAFFNPLCSEQEREQGQYWGERLNACFAQAIDQRRHQGGEDLISSMVQARVEGASLSDEEMITQCNLLLIAGNITTTDLIGNGVHALLQHPDQWRALCQQPELVDNAIEELLRFAPPVTNTGRFASRDMEISGCPVHRGESLSLSLAAANRDPRITPDPDRLDIERNKPRHWSFGGGAHFCLGAHLSRLEAREALLALVNRFPDLELVPEADPQPRIMPGFWGYLHMAVRPGSCRAHATS